MGGGSSRRSFAGGVERFTQLIDTPGNYTGAGGQFVVVNMAENALEYIPLPPLAITDTFVVISQAAMLALTAETGDIAIRTDTNETYILQGADPSILANWVLLLVSPVHAIGGAQHTADTIANVNTKLSDGDMITTRPAEINALTLKGTPTVADLLMIEDAADTNNKKKITLGSVLSAAYITDGASEGESSTTSGTFQQKLLVSFTATNGVRYKIDAYAECNAPADQDVEWQLTINGTEYCFGYHKSHSYAATWNKWNAGFYVSNSLSGTIDLKINWRNSYGANAKIIRRARILVTQI